MSGRAPRRVLPLRGAERFKALLRLRPVYRSAHFAVHRSASGKLSTGEGEPMSPAVDDALHHEPLRLGCVVPKRFARRAVTRNLVKRQIRTVVARQAQQLAGGDWLVRLRSPLSTGDAAAQQSAASRALRQSLRTELDELFAAAAAGPAA